MPQGPVALVTGATAGIGRALAWALGRSGYRVGVAARRDPELGDLVAQLREAGIEAAGKAADVSVEHEVAALVDDLTGELGPIDVLINNAGIGILKPIEELSVAEWDATMATNVRSLFLTTRAVLPGMRQRRSGTIVNVASQAGRTGFVGGTAYAASKHAVLGFSKALLLETRHDDIRVMAVCPGSVDTDLMRHQTMLKRDPERILKPEDVAQVIVEMLRLPARAMVSELDLRPTNPGTP